MVKLFAGVWVASVPKEMERRSILGVKFLSPKVIDMKIWKPTFPLAHFTPESLLFKRRVTESVMEGFHLARTQVETDLKTVFSLHGSAALQHDPKESQRKTS